MLITHMFCANKALSCASLSPKLSTFGQHSHKDEQDCHMRIPCFFCVCICHLPVFVCIHDTGKLLTSLHSGSPGKSMQSFVIYLIYSCQFRACNREIVPFRWKDGVIKYEVLCLCLSMSLCAGKSGFVKLAPLQSPQLYLFITLFLSRI